MEMTAQDLRDWWYFLLRMLVTSKTNCCEDYNSKRCCGNGNGRQTTVQGLRRWIYSQLHQQSVYLSFLQKQWGTFQCCGRTRIDIRGDSGAEVGCKTSNLLQPNSPGIQETEVSPCHACQLWGNFDPLNTCPYSC